MTSENKPGTDIKNTADMIRDIRMTAPDTSGVPPQDFEALRQVAVNPDLRQQYQSEKQPEIQMPENFELPENFKMIEQALQKTLAPALDYVRELQARDLQQTKLQARDLQQPELQKGEVPAEISEISTLEENVNTLLHQQSPTFSKICNGPAASATIESHMLTQFATNVFMQHLTREPESGWLDAATHERIVKKIAPLIEQAALKLSPTVAQKLSPASSEYTSKYSEKTAREMARQTAKDMYVESSGAVPASTASAFSQAYKKGDTAAMIAAIRQYG